MKQTIKRSILKITLATCAASLLCLAPASALSAFIKQGQGGQTGTPAPLILVDSATGQVGQAGLASTATVTVEKPGTFAYIAATGTLVDGTGGSYKYFPSAAETQAAGILLVRVTAPNVVQSDTAVQIVGFDPASDLGAATLAANGTAINGIPTALLARSIGHGMTLGQLLVLLQASNGASVTNAWNPTTKTLTTAYTFSGDTAPTRSDSTVYPTTQTTAPGVTGRTTTLGTIGQP